MKRNKLLISIASICLLLILVALPLASGCAKPAPSPTPTPAPAPAPAKEPIVVGFMSCFTGPFADYGPLMKEGIDMWLEEVKGEVAGRPVKVIIEDSASDTSTALEKAKKLVTVDKIDVFLGPLYSAAAMAVGPYLAQSKIPAIGLMTKPFELSKFGNYILPYASLYQEGMVLGWYAYDELGYRTAVTIGADVTPGQRFIAGFVDMFEERGGTVVQQQWPKPTETDFGPYLTSMKEADFSVNWLGTAQEMLFLKQYLEFGIKFPPLMVSGDGLLRSHQLKELGDAVVGVKCSLTYTSRLDNPANKKFVKAFRAKFGKPPERDQHSSYSAANIMRLGLEATGGDASFDKLYPAMLALKVDDPSGTIAFEPSGLGIVSKYIGEAKVVDGEYLWEPIKTYTDVRHPGKK